VNLLSLLSGHVIVTLGGDLVKRAIRGCPDVTQLEEVISVAVRRGRLVVPDEEELAEAA